MAPTNSNPSGVLWGIPAGDATFVRHVVDPDAPRQRHGGIARCRAELVSVPPPASQHLLASWPACRDCVRLECEVRGIPWPKGAHR